MKQCKILTEEKGVPVVNIPVLTGEEYEVFWGIQNRARNKLMAGIRERFVEFIRDKKQKIPAHLESIPLQKQYQNAEVAMVFAATREAMKRGKLYDGDYDNDANGINQCPAPMVMVVEK